MSIRCIDAAVNGSRTRGPARLVLFVLANYSDNEGKSWPGLKTLAEKCGMGTTRSVMSALATLRASGELIVHSNAGRHGQNVYQIAVAKLESQAAQVAAEVAKESSPMKDSSRVHVPSQGDEEIFMQPMKEPSPKPSMNRQEEPSVDGDPAAEACAVTALAPSAPSPAPASNVVRLGTKATTPAYNGLNDAAIPSRAIVLLAKNFELPEEWGQDAVSLGWPARVALREAEKFRQFWTTGKGQGTRRGVKGWRQSWSNWLHKAEKMNPNAATGARS